MRFKYKHYVKTIQKGKDVDFWILKKANFSIDINKTHLK